MEEIEKLKKQNQDLKKQNQELEEKLKNYTNPQRSKKFYEANKEKILKKRAERYQKEKVQKEKVQKEKNI